MPANHKVSVGWQIVFTFIMGLNFWAFYRIRKLRKYVLWVMVPHAANTAVFAYFVYLNAQKYSFFGGDKPPSSDPIVFMVQIVNPLLNFAILAVSIYLVIIWSRQHNQKYDQTPPPTET